MKKQHIMNWIYFYDKLTDINKPNAEFPQQVLKSKQWKSYQLERKIKSL